MLRTWDGRRMSSYTADAVREVLVGGITLLKNKISKKIFKEKKWTSY
jgi:hypothetical protein